MAELNKISFGIVVIILSLRDKGISKLIEYEIPVLLIKGNKQTGMTMICTFTVIPVHARLASLAKREGIPVSQ
ncbi:MAG: hypothetical protein CMF23_05725 [Ignavibacteriae bacterium]|nr:hypothetical protein [Ignavibacteriota bacterium]|tara:strand:- start:425 stop:643 length:219 start_codon:yes stop_codon:yes gene_type:complete